MDLFSRFILHVLMLFKLHRFALKILISVDTEQEYVNMKKKETFLSVLFDLFEHVFEMKHRLMTHVPFYSCYTCFKILDAHFLICNISRLRLNNHICKERE